MSDTLAWIQDELGALKAQGLLTTIRTLSSPQGAWLEVDGRRVLNFCSNNYLGLADHLGKEFGLPVDLVAVRGSGAMLSRSHTWNFPPTFTFSDRRSKWGDAVRLRQPTTPRSADGRAAGRHDPPPRGWRSSLPVLFPVLRREDPVDRRRLLAPENGS